MFTFYITNEVPDNQIKELIQALRNNTEATKESTMAHNKVIAALDKLETEMGELTRPRGLVV